ncbi:hypothetical protein, partial [Halorubrum sp. GN11_10-6_MGM]|uniref:hypothetical protein n=1 Tax=Halorubrum sp. GN11_10-6_MGM TaxID=2518112 RepID=UPI00130DF172
MFRTRLLRWLSVGIALCFVIGAVVVLTISGAHTASGELWDVERASDLEIGTEQQQVIANVEVLDSTERVKFHVGNLVSSGAKLDPNATSYQIDVDEKPNSSEVYIKNPNSSNATIVISASAISSTRPFDLHIDNIDTTNVSRYNREGSKVNRAITYTVEQGGNKAIVDFSVSYSGNVEFEPDPYDESTQSVFYQHTTNDSLSANTSVTIWKKKDNGDIGERIKTVEGTNQSISLKDTGIDGKNELIIGLHSSIDRHGLNATLFCRRLLILASCRCRVEEDKDTASAVSDTDDSARCVWVGIG